MTRQLQDSESDLGIQNTRSMRMDPEPPEEFHQMDLPGDAQFELLPVMSGETFQSLVNYPVIVETWDRCQQGRHRRAYLAEFTQAERTKIARYYGRFCKWYLVSGAPRQVLCRLNTIELLQRAVAFFAGV